MTNSPTASDSLYYPAEWIPNTYDYILWYAKLKTNLKYHRLFIGVSPEEWISGQQIWFETRDGTRNNFDPKIRLDGSTTQGWL